MKKNKIIALFMAFIMIFSTLVVPVSEVFAANVKWGKHIVTGYWVHKTTNPLDIKVINGERAFCVEPGASVTTIKGYSQKKPKYSASLWKKLVRIAHVGYNKDNNTKADFAATQVFLWNTINEAKGKKVDWSPTTNIPNYKKKFADIRAGLKDLDKLITTKPSFNKKNVTVSVGESVTLTDTNKVLSKGYKLVNVPDGITASISGNKLILKASVKAPNEFTLNLRLPDKNMVSDNRYFYHPSSQDVGHVGFIDPNYAKITVKVNKYGKAQITKKSESEKYIKGAKFNIKNTSGTVNKTSTTNSKGQILFSNLKPGTYYVKETYVPSPYLLDKTPKTVTVKANKTTKVSFENKLPRGHFILKKTKENGQPLVGAKFKIWSVGNDPEGKVIGFNKTLTTNSKGEISVTGLKLGNYKYQEIAAPDGYVLDKTVKDFSITYENSSKEVITVPKTVMNKMPRGKFTLTKKAVDKTPLAGAEYKIWSVGNDPEGKVIDYNKTLKTDSKGQITVTGLKLGTYKYQEVKAPSGYVLDKTVRSFTLKYQNQNTAVVGLTAERIDKKVEAEKLNINNKLVAGAELKVIDKDGKVVDSWTSTGTVHKIKNLVEGQKYTLVEVKAPKGYIKAKSVDFTVTSEKKDQTVSMTDMQTEIVKTDKDGKKLSGMNYEVVNSKGTVIDKGITSATERVFLNNLIEGEKYTIKEIKAPDGYVLNNKEVTFTAGEKDNVQLISIKNKQVVAKKLDVNGNFIKGAKLEVTDKDGKVVDSWTSEASTHIIKNLKVGKAYKLIEKEVPKGYVLANPVEFTVSENKETQTVKMIDQQVSLIKTDVDGNIVTGATFEIKDKENGKVVDTVSPMDKPAYISNLKEGKTYIVKEVATPEGYVTAKDIEFTVSDKIKEIKAVTVKNKQVNVFKENGKGELIEGAELKVIDKNNKVVDSWTTTNKAHNIKNLVEGQTYTLIEDYAPDGYVIARPVKFEVSFDKENQSVKMTDKQVEFVKTDVDGNALSGMEYTVTNNKSKEIVDKGVTSAKSRNFLNGLKIGETYTITETKVPTGFAHAKPIEFTVTEDSKLQTVTMKDKQVFVEKTSEKGEPVVGAELKVVNKDNEVIDSWTVEKSKTHTVKGLVENKEYTLIEDYAPDGFVLAKPVKFTVTDKKENQTISMVDKQVEFVKTDVDGNALSGMEYTVTNNKSKEIVDKGVTSAKSRNFLNGLKIGETYTITETKVPTGFAHAKPIEFTVTDDNKLQTVTMKDKQVVVKKTDIGGENVVGAELKVVDKETGDVIDSWTVKEDEPEHIVQGLIEGKEYTLIEDYAPDGFTISNSIDFTVTEDKVNQTVTMIDKVVDVDKINIEGESLKGVKLQVVNNKTKQIVDEWITNGTPHKVSLVEGMEYTLIELESIDGYALAKPVKFTVTSDKETQHIVMTDKKVQFKKLGLNNKTLTGGKFEIKDKETKKVVDTLSAEKKFIDVNNLVEGKIYIIHEVEAPKGYKIGEDVEFTVSYDKKTQKLVMKDVPDEGRIIVTDDDDFDHWEFVKTGDNFGLAMLVILLIASVVGTLFLGTDRKKKHK